MTVVSAVAVSGNNVGNVISDDLLGTNMLFHSDRLSQDSDFRDVIDQIGTSNIRYPGGTIAEEYFDLANPNSTTAYNVMDVINDASSIRTKSITTLNSYLEFVDEIGGDPVIVIPTYRYFDPDSNQMRPEAEAELRTFINELLSGTYGPVDQVKIELGNEWYQSRFDWNIEEFGMVQAQIAEWLSDEATDMGMRNDVSLLAQAGRNDAENASLSSHFSGDGHSDIDGVLTHIYATNSTGNALAIGSGADARLDSINDAWSQVLGSDFDLAVTEWNVGENGEDTTLINGTMRTAPLLRIYAEMIEAGVDTAMIWSAQTNGPAGLSSREGSGSELSPTGQLFGMLAEGTRGMQLVDPGDSFKIRDGAGEHIGYNYTFETEGHSVSYFASGVADSFTLAADLSAYYDAGDYVYARVLDVARDSEADDYWAEASVRYVTNIDLSDTGGIMEYLMNPYQLIEIHVVDGGQGISLSGDSHFRYRDSLHGTDFGDELNGHGGNDVLRGYRGADRLEGGGGKDILKGDAGDDYLHGGSGDDILYGGRSNDILIGGNGNDVLRGNRHDDELNGNAGIDMLYGGHGNDILNGGDDKDFLNGDAGNDILDGGTGDDNLRGGTGSDTFVFRGSQSGYDRILDFEIAEDVIDLTAFGFDDRQDVSDLATDTEYGLKIKFSPGNVLLIEDVGKQDIDLIDFLL